MQKIFATLSLLIVLSANAAAQGSYLRITKEMFSGYLYCLTTGTTEQRFEFLENGIVLGLIKEDLKTNVVMCWPMYHWRILGTKTLVLYDHQFTNVLRFKSLTETNATTIDGRQLTRQKVQPQRGADGSQPFKLLSDPESVPAGSRRSR